MRLQHQAFSLRRPDPYSQTTDGVVTSITYNSRYRSPTAVRNDLQKLAYRLTYNRMLTSPGGARRILLDPRAESSLAEASTSLSLSSGTRGMSLVIEGVETNVFITDFQHSVSNP